MIFHFIVSAALLIFMLTEVDPRNIINMDETPMYFDMGADTTYAPKGSKDVLITTTGYDKLRLTVVLTITASGGKLSPMIIFKNLKNVPKLGADEKWPEGGHKLVTYLTLYLCFCCQLVMVN